MNVRTALVTHLAAGIDDLGVNHVGPYQGELEELAKNPKGTPAGIRLPAALVLYLDGILHQSYQLHVWIVAQTKTLDRQGNATDGLALGQRVAEWLFNNIDFTGAGGENYAVDYNDVQVRLRKLTNSYTIVDVSVVVKEG